MPAFQDEYKPLEKGQRRSGLKINNDESIASATPKKPTAQQFEESVKDVEKKSSSFKIKMAELSDAFVKSINDKTLKKNKSIFSVEVEKENLSKLIQLASEINSDPNEIEGIGSLGLIVLLFKTLLSQRDRINELEYRLFQVENVNKIHLEKTND